MRTNGGSKKKLYPRILLQTPVNRSDHAELHGQSSINEHEALLTIPEPLPAGIQGTGPAHHWPKVHAGGTPAANFVAGCTLGLFARCRNGLKSRKRRNLRQNFIPGTLQILRKINFDPGIAASTNHVQSAFLCELQKGAWRPAAKSAIRNQISQFSREYGRTRRAELYHPYIFSVRFLSIHALRDVEQISIPHFDLHFFVTIFRPVAIRNQDCIFMLCGE